MIVVMTAPLAKKAVNDLGLPLSYSSIIRHQAAAKHLSPALIAGVIYAETKFDARTSPAGAVGLMQIEPATALFLAKRSGATTFNTSDLNHPAVNIAYGSYYLRYLLNEYHGKVAAGAGGLQRRPRRTSTGGCPRRGPMARTLTISADPVPRDPGVRRTACCTPPASTGGTTPTSSAIAEPQAAGLLASAVQRRARTAIPCRTSSIARPDRSEFPRCTMATAQTRSSATPSAGLARRYM